ncbi:hypothetical protein BU25DRAFT_448249 [Macroventuria anomochaeta]|uniref:Uncharacterized protein n=1 Tax=Macroventuria anomochaeta TaxID=301207 RepID=A0ACB6S0T4_9PLEO|nr:uncharacterized protein BU25DRAFT_448249 [Macroventuria anomochaeta]KAF2627751.1 hypothetical protein BU25DRAFT_448249 [Macroventuria anomochaeta]
MDIRKWLAETESPVPSKQPGVEHFLLPRQPDHVPNVRRRRKRSSSDSSLLKASSPQPRRKGVPAIERDHRDVRDAFDRAHSDASCSTTSESTNSSTASQRYARKPRRKTRPDKYGAGSKRVKEQDKSHRPSRKNESRKSKRKSKRRKDDMTHNGIGQDLKARNVSKDRLTLKPLEKMGLFSKGRTSTSVKRCGLPDLVFSEMKSLRTDHGANDHTTQASDAKKKRKKDHARTKEEDISAFFTSIRPALADTDENILAKSGHPTTNTFVATKADRPGRTREPSNVPDTAVPTVESKGKVSYLGFGIRGLRHESTSYFSWSESIRAPSITPVRPKTMSTVQKKRLDSSNQDVAEDLHGRHTAVRQSILSSVMREPPTATAERFRVSSTAPIPSGLSRSQSLPQHSSSPRRPNLVDRALHRRMTEHVTSPSSTLPVLQAGVNAEYPAIPITEGSRSGRTIRTSYASENAVLGQGRTSTDVARRLVSYESRQQPSSLAGVLQHCNDAHQVECRQATSRRSRHAEAPFSPAPYDIIQQTGRTSYQRTTPAPTVRFLAPEAQPSRLPNFSGPSFYAQQEHRQHLPVHFNLEEDSGYQHPDIVDKEYIGAADLLDQEDFEGLPGEPVSCAMMNGFDDDMGGLDYVGDGVEQMQEPEHTNIVAPGFWRPNRLY